MLKLSMKRYWRKLFSLKKLLTFLGFLCLGLYLIITITSNNNTRNNIETRSINTNNLKAINSKQLVKNDNTKTNATKTLLKDVKFKKDDTLVIGFPKSGKLYRKLTAMVLVHDFTLYYVKISVNGNFHLISCIGVKTHKTSKNGQKVLKL